MMLSCERPWRQEKPARLGLILSLSNRHPQVIVKGSNCSGSRWAVR